MISVKFRGVGGGWDRWWLLRVSVLSPGCQIKVLTMESWSDQKLRPAAWRASHSQNEHQPKGNNSNSIRHLMQYFCCVCDLDVAFRVPRDEGRNCFSGPKPQKSLRKGLVGFFRKSLKRPEKIYIGLWVQQRIATSASATSTTITSLNHQEAWTLFKV